MHQHTPLRVAIGLFALAVLPAGWDVAQGARPARTTPGTPTSLYAPPCGTFERRAPTPSSLIGTPSRDQASLQLRAAAGPASTFIHDLEYGHVTRARDLDIAAAVPGNPRASALAFMRAHFRAFGLPLEPQDGWLEKEVRGVAGTHHFALQQHAADGVPMYGALVTFHTDAVGSMLLVQSAAEPEPSTYRPAHILSAEDARKLTGDRGEARITYYRAGGSVTYRLAYQVDAGPLRSFVDAQTGQIVGRVDRRLFHEADGAVYDPNQGSSPNLSSVIVRQLRELDVSGYLRGRIAEVTDLMNAQAIRTPETPHYLFDPLTQPQQIEQTCIYFYLTEAGLKVESLFAGLADFTQISQYYPLAAFLDIDNDSNAYFDPSDHSFSFGQGNAANGIVNLQRDFDVAAHEFGHLIEMTLAPDGTPHVNSPRRAIGEGFGDYTAAVVQNALAERGGIAGAAQIGESTIPNDPVEPTAFLPLRDINPSILKRAPGDLVGEEHDDGEIVGEALWSLSEFFAGGGTSAAEATSASLDEGYRIVLAGLGFLPQADAQFSDLAEALLAGDEARTGGMNRTAIRKALAQHGISAESDEQPQEILLGVPGEVRLDVSGVARFYVRLQPSSASVLRISLSGATEAALFVAPNNYAGDAAKIVRSETAGTAEQLLTIDATGATGRDASGAPLRNVQPVVTEDVYWLIDVTSGGAGTFSLLAEDVVDVPVTSGGGGSGGRCGSVGLDLMIPLALIAMVRLARRKRVAA
ncbi:MAG: M36 family metallopeptidase [Planctomycetes bacterium]|nr:M36 family metallopeptidase [Planctomycetota bacterium]